MNKGILIAGAMGGLGRALVAEAEQLSDIDRIIATDNNERITDFYAERERVRGMVMDISSVRSIREGRDIIHKEGTSIRYVVNSAGIARFFPISEADENQLNEIIKVNTYGPVLTVSVFLKDLIENKGRVVQISSDNIRLSGLFQPYASSKIAMESLSIAMRQELALFGVKLILIRPGAINTDLLSEVKQLDTIADSSVYKKEFTHFTEIAQKEVGRSIEPSKVAKVVMKAITSKRPRLIYSINKNARISFLVKFPHRWIDCLVKKMILSK